MQNRIAELGVQYIGADYLMFVLASRRYTNMGWMFAKSNTKPGGALFLPVHG